jgi:hypothetical protein
VRHKDFFSQKPKVEAGTDPALSRPDIQKEDGGDAAAAGDDAEAEADG